MLNYLKLFPAWLFEVIRGNPRRAVRWHSPTPLLVIGHRGSPCFAIENTMASFQRAVEQDGANGLECDLCLTQDEQIVLWHDWDPDGFCRKFSFEVICDMISLHDQDAS
jgi:glycerophosphoryl diester phosphodiesterase